MRGGWFNVLVYVSVVFLLYALIKTDYIFVPKGINIAQALVSLLILFAGFVSSAYAWHRMLISSGMRVEFVDSLRSVGLSVFGKYVPGKIWSILGRSGYLAQRYPYQAGVLATVSVNAQLMTLWVGFALGVLGLLLLNEMRHIGWLMAFSWLVLTLSVFSNVCHRLVHKAVHIVSRRSIEFPQLSFVGAISTLPHFLIFWLLWVVSFVVFCNSFSGIQLSIIGGLGFALASSLGITAIIAPGGVGVREGVLVGYLAMSGVDVKMATAVAVASRAWFLLGEVFIFALALLVKKYETPVHIDAG